MQTTVQEESKNVKEDLKNIFESVVHEKAQDIKREFNQDIERELRAMRRDILEAVVHQEAKGNDNPLGEKTHSTDKDRSITAKSQLSEGKGKL